MNEYDSNRILDFKKKINYNLTKKFMRRIVMYLILAILERRQQKKFIMKLAELRKNLEIKKPIMTYYRLCGTG